MTRQVATTLQSLTIIERKQKFSCSEDSEGDTWNSSFAHRDVFGPLSTRIRHLTLAVEAFRPAYSLSTSSLQTLDITARVFYRGSIIDLPRSIRRLSLTFIDDNPAWWALSESMPETGRREHEFLDDLLFILSEDILIDRTPHLRILDISLPLPLKRSVSCWVKLYQVQKSCRRGSLLLRIQFNPNDNHRWGVPLGPCGRSHSGLPPPTPDSPLTEPDRPKKRIRKMFGFGKKKSAGVEN